MTAVRSSTQASATVKQTLLSRDATKDWEEPAFSARRGWPATVAFHQDRLVIGGARDLPNRIWLSKSGDLFNFDLGEGLDDDGIEFAILSDQVNAIRAVFSGRHLQVLTSGAEWMVTGDPLTPGNIQLKRQTRIGSPVDRFVPPRDVDGATLFAARNGRELREFLFADVEQAYQSNDLALLARHLIDTPVDQDYDPLGRLFHIVMADGALATVTVYRAEKVTGWSRQETDGSFLAIAVVDKTVYTLVERAGGRFIERFDASLSTDSALTGSDAGGKTVWSGLGHLEGATLAAVADDAVHPPAAVAAAPSPCRARRRRSRPACPSPAGSAPCRRSPRRRAARATARRSAWSRPCSACSEPGCCASIPAPARAPCRSARSAAPACSTPPRPLSPATSRSAPWAGSRAPRRPGRWSRAIPCPSPSSPSRPN